MEMLIVVCSFTFLVLILQRAPILASARTFFCTPLYRGVIPVAGVAADDEAPVGPGQTAGSLGKG